MQAERRIGLAAPSSSLVPLGTWLLESPCTPCRRCPFSEHRGHPLLGFHSSSGLHRRSPQRRWRPRDRPQYDAVPLMGFLFPTAIANSKEPSLPGFPTPQHVASSEFEPLVTPCSPSSLPTISGQVALGIHPSGLSSTRASGGPFGSPSPPGVTHSRRRYASNIRRGTRTSSRFMTPRECSSRPPSGPFSTRVAVPLGHRLRTCSEVAALLVFSLPKAFPVPPSAKPSPRTPLSCFPPAPLPFGVRTVTAAQRLSRSVGGVVSLESASLFEVSPLGRPTSSKIEPALGY